jgi:hypothetical protein
MPDLLRTADVAARWQRTSRNRAPFPPLADPLAGLRDSFKQGNG